MNFWREVFSDADGRGSSSRVGMMLGWVVGSFVVSGMAIANTLTDMIFLTYMGATGGVYGLNRWQDRKEKVAQIEADAPPSMPPPEPTIPSPITMNVGAAAPQVSSDAPISTKDMTVKADTVNVQKGGMKNDGFSD